MDNNIKIRGDWFLPDNPDKRFRGTLEYNIISGLNLFIEGNLFDSDLILPDLNLLYGETEKGEITLFRLQCTNTSRSSTIYNQSYFVNFALLGIYIDDFESEEFHSAYFEYFGLQDYFKTSGIKLSESYSEKKWEIHYKKPEDVKSKTKDSKIRIFFEGLIAFRKDETGKGNKIIQLKERIATEFSYSEPKSSIYTIQNANVLGTLFSLLSGNVIYISNVTLKSVRSEGVVKMYYNNLFSRNTYKNSITHTIPCNTLNNLPELIHEWFNKYDQFQSSLNLRNQAILSANKYDENRFLDSITALETFHRKFCNQEILSDDKIASTVNRVLKSELIEDELKGFFEKRLAPQTQKSLLQRLNDIFISIDSRVCNEICDNVNDYIKRLRDTRNSFTHNSGRKRKSILRMNEMANAITNSEKLLEYLILRELGISEEILINQFNQNNFFKKISSTTETP